MGTVENLVIKYFLLLSLLHICNTSFLTPLFPPASALYF